MPACGGSRNAGGVSTVPVSPRQRRVLSAMGITVWRGRPAADEPAVPVTPAAAGDGRAEPLVARATPDTAPGLPAAQASHPVADLDWAALEARVAACQACELHLGRTRAVFGRGDRNASWMIVGEGPGAEEDRQGLPFVGRAGQLLDRMVRAAGFDREAVYVANVVKCRPPNNRDPRTDEAASCLPFLDRQIALVRPSLLLAVGRVAAQRLLDSDAPVGRLRGRVHRYGTDPGVPVVVTYHPAYLLRSPAAKAKAWDDLKMALDLTEATGP